MEKIFPKIESVNFPGMGTEISVLLVVQDEEESSRAQADFTEIKRIYAEYEKIFSRFDPESELSKFNTHLGEYLQASPEMIAVIRRALFHYQKTSALFDPRILEKLEAVGYSQDFKKNEFFTGKNIQPLPEKTSLEEYLKIKDSLACFVRRMDFSGIVKGYVTDRVAEYLKGKKWNDFLVDSGGDMNISGNPPEYDSWNIAIEGINERQLAVTLSNQAIATSGISKRKWEMEGSRYHHLINPQEPDRFSFDLRTASVIAQSTEEADVLAKIIFIKDEEQRKKFIIEKGLAVILLYYSFRVWVSEEAKKFCAFSGND